jgi:phospholipid/cholesterol/gamma-HCH transport system substrate-binding protein
LTGALADNTDRITATLSNLEAVTGDLKEANFADRTVQTMESANAALTSMEGTLVETRDAVNSLKSILSGIEDGEGTLGKLANDPELYTNLNSMSRNLDLLLQDFRLNPKRYINVSVFGKKQKEYQLPEDDPAEQ